MRPPRSPQDLARAIHAPRQPQEKDILTVEWGAPLWFYTVLAIAAVVTLIRCSREGSPPRSRLVPQSERTYRNGNQRHQRYTGDIKEIQQDIKRLLLQPSGGAAFEGASPLSLTDLGREVAKELDASAWVKDLIPLVRDRVRGEPPGAIEESVSTTSFTETSTNQLLTSLPESGPVGMSMVLPRNKCGSSCDNAQG